MTSYVYTPSGPHTCSACSMGFSSSALLAKHQSRFCIGSGHDMVLVRNCKRCESRCHCHEEPMTERSRYNPNTDPKLQSLAENHGKQMEFLSNRNRDLERQRDEIRRRLGDLGRKPPEGDNTAALLAELRDQEARNQRLLDELKKQLLVSRQPVAIIGEQQQVQQKKSYTYPIYYGNSLVAEISAIRQAYIQSGGNDPEILAQLAQMLAEAQAIEDAMRNKKPPEPKQKEKKTEFSSHIMTMDMENERLNRELFLLQQQNTMAKGRRKDDREGRLPRIISSGLDLSNPYALPLLQSQLGSKPLYSSRHNDSDLDTNVLLNSLGRPGSGLGYGSLYQPGGNVGLSHRNSFLGEGGHTTTSKYGLQPTDSVNFTNRGLVDTGTSPILSSRLNRSYTTLGLEREPHVRKPYPLDYVLGPPGNSYEENNNTHRSHMPSTTYDNENDKDVKTMAPKVPRLNLDSDQTAENNSQNNQPKETEKKPKKGGLFSSLFSKKGDKTQSADSDSSRSVIIEPVNPDNPPTKSALKKGKTLEPSSAADLNNHPSNRSPHPEQESVDWEETYRPSLIQRPTPRKLQDAEATQTYHIPYSNSVKVIMTDQPPNTVRSARTPAPILREEPPADSVSKTTPFLVNSPRTTNDAPEESVPPISIHPAVRTLDGFPHPDTYRSLPDTLYSQNIETTPWPRPRPVNKNDSLSTYRSRPKPSPIPEESYSDRPITLRESDPSPFDDNESEEPTRNIIHSYPKLPTDPSDPYNYYAETGWPQVDHETMHKDHKGYKPLNPEKEGQSSARSQNRDTSNKSPFREDDSFRKQAESEAKKQEKAIQDARKNTEDESKKQAKVAEDAKKTAALEAKKQAKAAEETRKKAEAEAKKQAKAAEEARKKAEAEAKKLQKNAKNVKQNAQNEAEQKAQKAQAEAQQKAQKAQAEAQQKAQKAQAEAQQKAKKAQADAEQRAQQAQIEAEKSSKNAKGQFDEKVQQAQTASNKNLNSAKKVPENTYRFKDNFVSRTKNDAKKAVTFSD